MIGCGTNTFTDPDDYRTHVPGAEIALVQTGSEGFNVHVVWVNLPHLSLVRVDERAARVAFVSLRSRSAFISFPLRSESPSFWNGVRLQQGEIAFHARGEQFHQRSAGPARWGLISLAPRDLAAYGKIVLGAGLVPPRTSRLLRPPRSVASDVLCLHRQACRLAEEKPDMIMHREVTRALEQELVSALINGLSVGELRDHSKTRQRHAEIMVRFEHVLAAQIGRQLPMSELCDALGVSERTLRICCMEFLGCGPADYARLRRLNLARSALARGAPPNASVAAIAREHGFTELGRFATTYREMFGELPSATLRRSHRHRVDQV